MKLFENPCLKAYVMTSDRKMCGCWSYVQARDLDIAKYNPVPRRSTQSL